MHAHRHIIKCFSVYAYVQLQEQEDVDEGVAAVAVVAGDNQYGRRHSSANQQAVLSDFQPKVKAQFLDLAFNCRRMLLACKHRLLTAFPDHPGSC